MKNKTDEALLLEKLEVLYGDEAEPVLQKLLSQIQNHVHKLPKTSFELSERDAVLITYGDSIQKKNRNPLAVLNDFAAEYLKDAVSIVHVLPFFP